MTDAEKILLRLDAHECWAAGRVHRSRASPEQAGVEPVVVHPSGSTFGLTMLGTPSIADLQNILVNWDIRMRGLEKAYSSFASSWQSRDSAAFIEWTADWTRLKNRYNAAVQNAQGAVSSAKWNPLPATEISAQSTYDGLARAMRQCYPPDGCPVVKGDWSDLDDRLTAAMGKAVAYAPMVQPTVAQEGLAGSIYTATTPLDVIAHMQGLTGPPVKPPGVLDRARLVVTGVAMGGGGAVGMGIGGPVGALIGAALAFGVIKLLGRKSY